MVEHIDGRGQHYRDAQEQLNLSRKFGFRFISPRDTKEETHLLNQLTDLPEFDSKSILISNVFDAYGRPKRVLALPEACPTLNRIDHTTEGLKEGETFVVEVWEKGYPSDKITYFFTANDSEHARMLARIMAGNSFGWTKWNVEADPKLVTVEEFKRLVKERIDAGKKVSELILIKTGLREYARMVRNDHIV